MNSKPLTGMLALALLISCMPVAAQTQASPPPTEQQQPQQQKAKKELEQKALALLDEVIKDGQSFRVPENRLHVKAIAAGLLWKYDEPRARILFKETMAGIIDLLNNQGSDEAATPRMLQGMVQLRREVLQLLATRDARMARDFLRATRRPDISASKSRYGDYESDIQLEYSLVTTITETDPKQALEIAEESLSKGFSYELINTLETLRRKDPEAAKKLAGEIVSKLRSENLLTNNEAANIAYNLMGVVFSPSSEGNDKEAKKSDALLDAQAKRDLMEMNINYALNSPNGGDRLQSLARMMPEVEKYAPARVAELRRKTAQRKPIEVELSDGMPGDWEKYRVLMEKGTPDELLAAAPKAPSSMRDSLYQLAANKLAASGETDRAREIINAHVSEPYMRKQMLAELERQSSLTAAEQGKMEQVRKSLASLPTNEQRALTLAQIAEALAEKGEKKIARQLLSEAQNMVSNRAKNMSQLSAQLLIAKAYARLDPERSMAMLEPIVDQLNELLAAAVTLGGFILDEEVMRDDEIRLELFTATLPNMSGHFAPDLRSLASFDFDRTRALADRFQRDEARMLARLLVAQSILAEQIAPENPGGRTVPTTTTVTATTPITSPEVQEVKDEGDGAP